MVDEASSVGDLVGFLSFLVEEAGGRPLPCLVGGGLSTADGAGGDTGGATVSVILDDELGAGAEVTGAGVVAAIAAAATGTSKLFLFLVVIFKFSYELLYLQSYIYTI